MRLSELLKSVSDYTSLCEQADCDIKGITCNSKEVRRNFLFVAVKGARGDGHAFIREAVEKGAKAVIVQARSKKSTAITGISCIKVTDSRKAVAELAAAYYGNPSRSMKIIGITGTNGKTTVSYLIESFLKKKRQQCAVIGTINYRFKDIVLSSKNTTPGPLELQALLKRVFDAGVRYAAMEVSSHALDQKRTDGIQFSAAIFTNVTQDHLDYHKNFERYFAAKARLFKGLLPSALAVINNDDEYAKRLKGLTDARIITYGVDEVSDVFARNIKMDMEKTQFQLCFRDGQRLAVKTSLIGRHNIYNILASAAWAREDGFSPVEIKSGIENFSSVPGRLEQINSHRGFWIYVDYAHTEDALRNVITSLRQISRKRIIVVFGCGGDRDRSKRPLMGRAVSDLADYTIITNDNPRSEEPLDIIREIVKGITGVNYQVIPDRAKAIAHALSLARKGDIILLAGKGHENYQIIKDKVLHFDDREAVRKCLQSLS